MFWPFETGISVIDLPSGSLSGCDKGITSSSTACLPPMGAIGCILIVSFILESEFIFADIHDKIAMHLGYCDEQRHPLIVAERYLVGPGAFQDVAFGCQDFITSSPLGFRTLG
jgi:hypothetical protein